VPLAQGDTTYIRLSIRCTKTTGGSRNLRPGIVLFGVVLALLGCLLSGLEFAANWAAGGGDELLVPVQQRQKDSGGLSVCTCVSTMADEAAARGTETAGGVDAKDLHSASSAPLLQLRERNAEEALLLRVMAMDTARECILDQLPDVSALCSLREASHALEPWALEGIFAVARPLHAVIRHARTLRALSAQDPADTPDSQAADASKQAGNALFREGEHGLALECYLQGLLQLGWPVSGAKRNIFCAILC